MYSTIRFRFTSRFDPSINLRKFQPQIGTSWDRRALLGRLAVTDSFCSCLSVTPSEEPALWTAFTARILSLKSPQGAFSSSTPSSHGHTPQSRPPLRPHVPPAGWRHPRACRRLQPLLLLRGTHLPRPGRGGWHPRDLHAPLMETL